VAAGLQPGPGEVRPRPVWPRGVAVVQGDREDSAQGAFVPDQHPGEELTAQCSDHPFADRVHSGRSGWAGLVRIWIPFAAKTASNALMNLRGSRSRSAPLTWEIGVLGWQV
jgi:hypothetical protein